MDLDCGDVFESDKPCETLGNRIFIKVARGLRGHRWGDGHSPAPGQPAPNKAQHPGAGSHAGIGPTPEVFLGLLFFIFSLIFALRRRKARSNLILFLLTSFFMASTAFQNTRNFFGIFGHF